MNVHEPEWTPPFSALRPDEGCLEMDLPDFDLNLATKGKGKNTIAIKFMAPQDAKRFRYVLNNFKKKKEKMIFINNLIIYYVNSNELFDPFFL